MKKYKAILALLLVAALLCMLFAACGTSETQTQDNPGQTGEDQGSADTQPDSDVDDAPVDEEVAEIKMLYFDLRMTGADFGEHVENAINELTEREINTHVDITWMTVGDWIQKAQLMISGGEQIDVMQLGLSTGVAIMYTNTMLTDITDYMAQYAPETLELMADYIGTYTYGGRIYGVPTMRNLVTNGYVIMRKDILEELGLLEKAENLNSWSAFEEILAAVYEAYNGTGVYPIANSANKSIISGNGAVIGGDSFDEIIRWDTLGDNLGVVRTDADGNVSLYQASEEYEAEIKRVKTWRENGWVYPDAALTDSHGDELMKQGVSFASIQTSEAGVEIVKGTSTGYAVVCPMTYPGMIKTSTLTSWGIGVPITAEEPEAACKLINMLYTSSELMNLITWGVEGTDYELVDGQVKQPESGYYYEADFLIGNNLLLTPLYGNGADFFDKAKALVDAAELSPYLGFALETGDLELVISQISAVYNQYYPTMNCGEYTEEAYQDYLSKLDVAGVQDYLDAVQSQLNAWLAEQ